MGGESAKITVANTTGATAEVSFTYVVEGEWLFNLVGQVNFYNRESLSFFQRVLLKSGVIEKLKEAGCKDGDAVSIYDFEFDFVI